MATSKGKSSTVDDVMKNLGPLAKGLEKTAAQLWHMFVMRYVAKAVAEIFIALFIAGIDFYYVRGVNHLWQLPMLVMAAIFIYDAIQLLLNPYYFAMNDVSVRLKSEHSIWSKN